MLRYYTNSPSYRVEGPPRPFLRGIAPIVVGSTVALLGSGVGVVVGRQAHFFRALHSASFAIFVIVVGAHAIAHLPKVRHLAFSDHAQGHALRRATVGFALVTGGAIAVVTAQTAGPWIAAMQHGLGG